MNLFTEIGKLVCDDSSATIIIVLYKWFFKGDVIFVDFSIFAKIKITNHVDEPCGSIVQLFSRKYKNSNHKI